MAKERSEKSKYPSRYSPDGWVSAAQYITELICEKKAKLADKNAELPQKFWALPEWNRFFRQQIGSANQLLKYYSEKAIIGALSDKEAWNVYSLRAPHLIRLIVVWDVKVKKEEAALIEKAKTSTVNRADTTALPREKEIQKNALSRLEGL